MRIYAVHGLQQSQLARALAVFLFILVSLGLIIRPLSARTTGASRKVPIDMIVIHSIGGPTCVRGTVVFDPIVVRRGEAESWKHYLESQPVDGIHYVIGRDGTVAKSIPEDQIANHATVANGRSIGIELVHRGDGKEPFPSTQVDALITLIKDIRSRYSIPLSHIVRHSDVDQRFCPCAGQPYHRRQDPGANFPLDSVRAAVAAPGEKTGTADFLKPLTGDAPLAQCPANR
jgi:N-acetylmuramoyl-L-alanine amidase